MKGSGVRTEGAGYQTSRRSEADDFRLHVNAGLANDSRTSNPRTNRAFFSVSSSLPPNLHSVISIGAICNRLITKSTTSLLPNSHTFFSIVMNWRFYLPRREEKPEEYQQARA